MDVDDGSLGIGESTVDSQNKDKDHKWYKAFKKTVKIIEKKQI